MRVLLLLLCVSFSVGVTLGRPSQSYRVLPRRAVMFGGYYSNPLFGRSYSFIPQGSMSAVVTRNAVATNTYAGNPPQYPPLDTLPLEENETAERVTERAGQPPPIQYGAPETPFRASESVTPSHPVQLELELPHEEPFGPSVAQSEPEVPLVEDVALAEEVSTEAVAVTKATKRVAKKKVIKPPPVKVDEEEEEEDDDSGGLPASWPFAAGGKGSSPSYTAFFPINISGGSPARSRSQGHGQGQGLEDYFPGSATAIANSFSTGKGGIATSHATSFGDPYLASLVRNGLLNFRSKKHQES